MILNLMVLGYGGHGKDYFGEILNEEKGYTFISPSWFTAANVVYPKMKHLYNSVEECYNDRYNHREFWYRTINDYNQPTLSKVGEGIFAQYDICCGVRDREELFAIRDKKIYNYSFWVDACERLGVTEGKGSMTVTKDDADFIIYNNGTIEEFGKEVRFIVDCLEVYESMRAAISDK